MWHEVCPTIGMNDMKFDELPDTVRSEVFAWIKDHLKHARDSYNTGYSIKHKLQEETNIYLTEEQMNRALTVSNFKYVVDKGSCWFRCKYASYI